VNLVVGRPVDLAMFYTEEDVPNCEHVVAGVTFCPVCGRKVGTHSQRFARDAAKTPWEKVDTDSLHVGRLSLISRAPDSDTHLGDADSYLIGVSFGRATCIRSTKGLVVPLKAIEDAAAEFRGVLPDGGEPAVYLLPYNSY